MKKICYLTLLVFLAIGILSCTKNFKNINTNPNGLPFDPGEGEGNNDNNALENASLVLPNMMQYIYVCNGGIGAWYYQAQQNLNIDVFGGYWMPSSRTGFGTGIKNEACYTLVHNWDDFVFNAWREAMNPFNIIRSSGHVYPNETNKALLGMGYVVKVLLSVKAADAIGTLPYTSFGSSNATYDGLEKIYTTFFNELDSALSYLDSTKKTTSGVSETQDYFYGGDQQKWTKLANSLRLRLAMRLSKVDEPKSREQAKKAMEDPGGLILSNNDNAAFGFTLGEPAITTLISWGSCAVSADIYSFLVGYNDPRLPVFMAKTNATDNIESRIPIGGYVSQRLGTTGISTAPNGRVYSKGGTGIGAGSCKDNPESCTFFNAAETNFLLAEVALRSFLTGSFSSTPAKTFYENGIKASMEQWKLTGGITSYLASTSLPASYKDPATPAADIDSVSTCKVSWDNGTSNEERLEKIITQKWLAMWPVNSSEAWSEYRRTGYPTMFPGYTTAVAPTIMWGGRRVNNARKIRLPLAEYFNNATNVSKAINDYFVGGDEITTHVWWDIDKGNF